VFGVNDTKQESLSWKDGANVIKRKHAEYNTNFSVKLKLGKRNKVYGFKCPELIQTNTDLTRNFQFGGISDYISKNEIFIGNDSFYKVGTHSSTGEEIFCTSIGSNTGELCGTLLSSYIIISYVLCISLFVHSILSRDFGSLKQSYELGTGRISDGYQPTGTLK
jgi:hypothetical protein